MYTMLCQSLYAGGTLVLLLFPVGDNISAPPEVLEFARELTDKI